MGDGTTRRIGREPVVQSGYRRGMDHYYNATDLPRFADMGKDAPELWDKFLGWYSAVFAEGALTEREKALIALAVSHAVQCPYCIDAYTTGSLEKGATPEQMTEAVHVAAAIRGGASLVHGVQMRNKLEKISM
jgi:alkylhydroperoxidase/carboxymuconolactone decarboxylase family protein